MLASLTEGSCGRRATMARSASNRAVSPTNVATSNQTGSSMQSIPPGRQASAPEVSPTAGPRAGDRQHRRPWDLVMTTLPRGDTPLHRTAPERRSPQWLRPSGTAAPTVPAPRSSFDVTPEVFVVFPGTPPPARPRTAPGPPSARAGPVWRCGTGQPRWPAEPLAAGSAAAGAGAAGGEGRGSPG